MMAILMLTSKGMAGVPRASLVVIAATLNQFNIPEAGLLLILGVDTFLDMGRSATNAVGNSIAASVVAKWEGGLMSEKDADANARRLDKEMDRSLHPDVSPAAA
jgi:Na+/H+-dicarboxylate symporter